MEVLLGKSFMNGTCGMLAEGTQVGYQSNVTHKTASCATYGFNIFR